MNKYLIIQNEFKNKLLKIIYQILEKYKYQLELKIENINLLKRNDNCISSSTAIGFCLEEFITIKLIEETSCNKFNTDEIFIERDNNKKTQNSSFDFFSNFKENIFFN